MEEEKIVTNDAASEAVENTKAAENTEAAVEAAAITEAAPKEETPVKKNDEESLIRKILFCLCYLWGILFFLPILVYRNDEEAKVHANQGLALLLLAIGGNVLFGLLTMIAPLHTLFSIIAGVYSAALLVLGIMGIINVVTDNDKKLPIISGFKLIK